MKKCINKFTDREYEAIQYCSDSRENRKIIIDIIKHYFDISIRVIMPTIIVHDLNSVKKISTINVGDWLIKSKNSNMFKVISNGIMNSNFTLQ